MAEAPKSVDAAERAFRLQILTWAAVVGLFLGGAAGGGIAELQGANPLIGIVIGIPTVTGLIYVIAQFTVKRAGAAAGTIYHPSGASTPRKPEYSRAASLVARGRYAEAAIAYELHAVEAPEDPEPYFQLARLYRDHLKQPEEALTWFRRARSDATLGPGQELYVIQEVIDLYFDVMRTPRKAIPELTRVCQRFPGTPAARAAEKQLALMREQLARERDALEPFTAEFMARIRRVRGETD
ncbi:MAG TPA: hypothetical protein VF970_16305 [Gemmatimonadales bacterium]